jgi:glycosyltransferase involved in cell wall biosynthesis
VSNQASICEVAVIIPCYNAASCLARALDSALAQTLRDSRIFVIDDGSTDQTDAVLRSYASRIVRASQPHAGQAAARNHGIRLSNSPYVAFLDADDEWLPEKLERQIEILKRDPQIGLVYSDCSTSGTGPDAGSHFARVGIQPSGRVFERFLDSCNVFTPTVIVRRECLEDVGVFNESLPVCEDFNLWLRIAAKWKVAVIPEVLAIRHRRAGSLSLTTGAVVSFDSSIASFMHVMQANPHLSQSERHALRKTIANRHYQYGAYLLKEGERTPSRRQMLQAMRYGRFDWRVMIKFGLGLLPRGAFASLIKLRQALKTRKSGTLMVSEDTMAADKVVDDRLSLR